MGRPFKCPYCSNTDTTWKGYRRLVRGKIRMRMCKECRRKFTPRIRRKNDRRRRRG